MSIPHPPAELRFVRQPPFHVDVSFEKLVSAITAGVDWAVENYDDGRKDSLQELCKIGVLGYNTTDGLKGSEKHPCPRPWFGSTGDYTSTVKETIIGIIKYLEYLSHTDSSYNLSLKAIELFCNANGINIVEKWYNRDFVHPNVGIRCNMPKSDVDCM